MPSTPSSEGCSGQRASWSASLRHDHELLIAEVVHRGVFDDASPAEVATLVSCLIEEARSAEDAPSRRFLRERPKLRRRIRQMEEAAEAIEAVQRRVGLHRPARVQSRLRGGGLPMGFGRRRLGANRVALVRRARGRSDPGDAAADRPLASDCGGSGGPGRRRQCCRRRRPGTRPRDRAGVRADLRRGLALFLRYSAGAKNRTITRRFCSRPLARSRCRPTA